jgi:murein DD-endopeptidase MepM/ murein hydrolase activator NlpD
MDDKRLKIIGIALIFAGFILYAPFFVVGQYGEDINEEIKDLNSQISGKKNKLEDIQKKQEEYADAIRKKQAQKADLSNQLAILDNRIAKSELDIEVVETNIDRTDLEINKTNLEIATKETEIIKEKEHIASVLRLLYKQDKASALEIILLNNTLSEFLNQVKYLEDINSELGDSLDNLKQYKDTMDEKKADLVSRGKELADLKTELDDKKNNLVGEKDGKNYLLDQTRSSEKEYQRLLAAAKAEQERAASDIVSLEKKIREKMSEAQKQKLAFNDKGLIWPVRKNTVTAYFHDPDYPFRYIFEHPAIDIRASQGTTVKASASGYVARAKDGGRGYSYIMIVHGDGLATVYGHVSKIFVQEDEYVVQGQAIGASGGMPGTPGAGGLTTGAHLHFEVRKDGIPVNALEYLP